MPYNVTDGSTQIENILGVEETDLDASESSRVTVLCEKTSNNQNISKSDDVTVELDGNTEFVGKVKNVNETRSENVLELVITGQRNTIQSQDVDRVFYNKDAGDVVNNIINEKTQPQDRKFTTKFENLSDINSDSSTTEYTELPKYNLTEHGTNSVFLGLEKGSSGTYTAKISNINQIGLNSGQGFFRFDLKALINDEQNALNIKIHLKDNNGVDYVWEIDEIRGWSYNYQFNAEEAEEKEITNINNGEIAIKIELENKIEKAIGMVLDSCRIIPYEIRERDFSPTVDFAIADREIKRRINDDIISALENLTDDDSAQLRYNNRENKIEYKYSDKNSGITIDDSLTILDFQEKEDYDVVNRVVVSGDGVTGVAEDRNLIKQYGRVNTITKMDTSLNTKKECERRAQKILENEGGQYRSLDITIEGLSTQQKQQLKPQSTVNIDYDGIQGVYKIREKDKVTRNIITINVLGPR